jgi:hypothetical protein
VNKRGCGACVGCIVYAQAVAVQGGSSGGVGGVGISHVAGRSVALLEEGRASGSEAAKGDGEGTTRAARTFLRCMTVFWILRPAAQGEKGAQVCM